MPFKVHPRLEIDIGWADLWFALTGKTGAPEGSEQAIQAVFADRPCIPTLSVRSGLLALLRALKPAPGSEVVMSAVNIEHMADIVRAEGLTPVPADIDLDTLAPSPETVRGLISDKTALYLHAHLYGSRTDLGPVSKICRARNVLLVEDCAQAYDGKAWAGSPEADVSLFSFGPIKPATTLGGAVVRFRSQELAGKVRAEMVNWPVQGNAAIVSRARKMIALKALSEPHLYSLVLAAMRLRGNDADKAIGAAARGFKPGDLLEQIAKRPSPKLLSLMARRLASPPDNSWRRDCAGRLRASLRADIETPGAGAPHHAWWLFPILVQHSDDVIAALRQEGFDATRGATSMRVIEGGRTLNARRLLRDVVYLPLSPRLRPRDIDRMAAVVNRLAALPQARAA